MKYRDLIAVICLVALVMVGWSQTEREVAPSAQSQVVAPSKTPKEVEASRKRPLVKLSPEPKKKHRFSRPEKPTLTLEVVDSGSQVQDLVLKTTMVAQSDTTLKMYSDQIPHLEIIVADLTDGAELNWNFHTNRSVTTKSRHLKTGEAFEWEIRMSQLVPPENLATLKSVYGEKPLDINLIMQDGDAEADPYSRRLVRTFFQSVKLAPFKVKP